ncbi:MAG: L-seryl-tRNA(Sec) selenium transferase [Proteobacteria bacterium]|nr:L-seryl-tRNA(Sec) selenium transferase [Pseudomonadota bacterium]MBU1585445.1 L-seryl-tRNA(Sec) selenium transferase [Pseudomonadota bacterium]MBU2452582.1 L-seryl-tRNA(Sec) selenium transferase [Pseudomonadota bacterium]
MMDKHKSLRHLPGVDHLLELAKTDHRFSDIPRSAILDAIRQALDNTRKELLSGIDPSTTDETLLLKAQIIATEKIRTRLVTIINATGVVLHTNLGRALLCKDALDNIKTIAQSYSNLELRIETGKRGIRYEAVEELICELTGAQSAIVVNNNAGAVLLALNTIAQNTQVVVSRGELVEIGGSFRVPDVMSKSGCILKEVGTTNRTHLRDYETAVCDATGLFLKVHASNYTIQGFTASVSLKDLVLLGKEKNIPVMEDLGSGTLIDFSKYGLPPEPTVADSVRSGADVVTFSGDKLLGGPQAGIIVGQKKTIDLIKKNPLTRALRIDKLTLAALESTLKLYRDEEKAIREIPTLRMLTLPFEDICKKADLLFKTIKETIGSLADIDIADMNSRPGGGSFPELNLPTRCITLQPRNMSVSKLEINMRLSTPAIIGRIEDNKYILDPRTIQEGQDTIISSTLGNILANK